MREIRSIKQWTEAFREVHKWVEELQIVFEFSESGDITQQELEDHYSQTKELIENLETKNMLRREEDRFGAVLKINAGAGGTESNDWADMLLRM